jgi:hypothetical protein
MLRSYVKTSLPLAAVVEAMVPPLAANPNQRRALVLHLDEFQENPAAVAAMLRAVRDFNASDMRHLVVLPVMTGLVADPTTQRLTGFGVSRMSYITYHLTYFGAAHVEMTWQLVKNAAAALNNRWLAGISVLKAAPRLLRYLVEDTFGWQVAAVFLGAAIARVLTVPPARNPAESAAATAARMIGIWSAVECAYVDYVRALYQASHFEAALKIESSRKLLLLALSPHKVWGSGGERTLCMVTSVCHILLIKLPRPHRSGLQSESMGPHCKSA